MGGRVGMICGFKNIGRGPKNIIGYAILKKKIVVMGVIMLLIKTGVP